MNRGFESEGIDQLFTKLQPRALGLLWILASEIRIFGLSLQIKEFRMAPNPYRLQRMRSPGARCVRSVRLTGCFPSRWTPQRHHLLWTSSHTAMPGGVGRLAAIKHMLCQLFCHLNIGLPFPDYSRWFLMSLLRIAPQSYLKTKIPISTKATVRMIENSKDGIRKTCLAKLEIL